MSDTSACIPAYLRESFLSRLPSLPILGPHLINNWAHSFCPRTIIHYSHACLLAAMPGTTYPSSAYPGQVQSVYRSQSTGYVYPNIRPSVTPGTGVTNTARPIQNTVLNNTPRRRLTPYESNTTNSAYYERNAHPSFDHPRQSQANNSPSPSPPHLQQMPYHQYHNFNRSEERRVGK